MRCPVCNNECGNGRFCNNCGQSLDGAMPCPQCGSTLLPGAAFCAECGYRVAQAPQAPAPIPAAVGMQTEMISDNQAYQPAPVAVPEPAPIPPYVPATPVSADATESIANQMNENIPPFVPPVLNPQGGFQSDNAVPQNNPVEPPKTKKKSKAPKIIIIILIILALLAGTVVALVQFDVIDNPLNWFSSDDKKDKDKDSDDDDEDDEDDDDDNDVDSVNVADASIIIDSQIYTGSPIEPAVQVILGGEELEKDDDYTVTFTNNVAHGTATATIAGIGDYEGTVDVPFAINFGDSVADDSANAQSVAFVERLYTEIYGRRGTGSEITSWTGLIVSRQFSAKELVISFFNGPEFLAANHDNTTFVQILYRAVFGREADEGGLNAWVGVLNQGTPRSEVVDQFTSSDEFINMCATYGIGQDAATTGNNSAVSDVNGYTQIEVANVMDESSDRVLIYGWNEEFPGLVSTYSSVPYDLEITESNTYQAKLDMVLASGDNAPDLFVCDADYASKYMNSSNTLPINALGISYSELNGMYNYTLQFATDDNNVIKGLAWQCCPAGVFYNRDIAANYFGVSEPEDVAPYFATWDAFIQTARDVNARSGGAVKAVSGVDDIWRSYLNTRTMPWIVDGQVCVDPVMESYFDLAKTLHDESLTFETSQWGDTWTANMSNQSVLSYWGPMWLARFSMGLNDQGTSGSNPTSGRWGLVQAPSSYYWGGTWMMASKYCDMKASCAQIMRDIAINDANLTSMANGGEFVNNIYIMTEIANNSNFSLAWLGGQNPAAVLCDSASLIDNSTVGMNDQAINDVFNSVVNSYLYGEIPTVADAEMVFATQVEELGIV